MAENWYPIISGGCTKCMACVVACPLGLLTMENNQVNLSDAEKCPENCEACQVMCSEHVIHFFNGTTESIIEAFEGKCCSCGCGHNH